MTRRGIDTSHWNHTGNAPIDWTRLRQGGISWVAIKLTEGSQYVDPWADRDLHAAKAVGMETVLYHFARPTQSGPAAQAHHFLRAVATVGGADLAALDLEDGRQLGWRSLARWAGDYLGADAAQLIYWARDYQAHLSGMMRLDDVHQWVAAPSATHRPDGATVWQYGQVAIQGVPGHCDVDQVFYERGEIGGAR